MPHSPRASAAALLAWLAACAPGGSPAVPVQPSSALPATVSSATDLSAEADAARAVAAAFIAAEARGDRSGDTLLATGADFIMGGIIVTNRPRLAALVGRGAAVVEDAVIGVSGAFAYVVAVYRFDSPTASLRDRARATFVLERRPAGWRIRHVHTSMVERW